MRAALGRGLLVISIALGAALTIVGVIGQLSIPGPLVPATEGVLFLILLGWVHWQYLSRRRDSPAYRQHLGDLQAFARDATDSGLYLRYQSGLSAATRLVNMSLPRAQDFRAHFPDAAKKLDEWNQIADGWSESGMRFQGLCHKVSEPATGETTNTFPQLLRAVGEGEISTSAITWRVENGRLEASWVLDLDKEPAWSPIVTQDPSIEKVDRVWEALRSFPELQPVAQWRARRIAHDSLRPQLLNALEHAEIAVELKGRCPHCPN